MDQVLNRKFDGFLADLIREAVTDICDMARGDGKLPRRPNDLDFYVHVWLSTTLDLLALDRRIGEDPTGARRAYEELLVAWSHRS